MDYGSEVQRDDRSKTTEQVYDNITEVWHRPVFEHQYINICYLEVSPFVMVNVLPQLVTVRKFDFKINLDHIRQASDQPKDKILEIREEYSGGYDIVLDAK